MCGLFIRACHFGTSWKLDPALILSCSRSLGALNLKMRLVRVLLKVVVVTACWQQCLSFVGTECTLDIQLSSREARDLLVHKMKFFIDSWTADDNNV
jgi:hypothetical protein